MGRALVAWTTPRTWVTSEVVKGSFLNASLRDNFNVQGPAIATATGDLVYGAGSHQLQRLPKGTSAQILKLGPTWEAPPLKMTYGNSVNAELVRHSMNSAGIYTIATVGATQSIAMDYVLTRGTSRATGLRTLAPSDSPANILVLGSLVQFTLASGVWTAQFYDTGICFFVGLIIYYAVLY
jgi:hypothetical protein